MEPFAQPSTARLQISKAAFHFKFRGRFYCPECHLVIEVDGAYHEEKLQAEYDAERTLQLTEKGIRVVRFTNEEVCNKTEFVIDEIVKCLPKKADPKRTHSKKNLR